MTQSISVSNEKPSTKRQLGVPEVASSATEERSKTVASWMSRGVAQSGESLRNPRGLIPRSWAGAGYPATMM
jgi:hypothetical protein